MDRGIRNARKQTKCRAYRIAKQREKRNGIERNRLSQTRAARKRKCKRRWYVPNETSLFNIIRSCANEFKYNRARRETNVVIGRNRSLVTNIDNVSSPRHFRNIYHVFCHQKCVLDPTPFFNLLITRGKNTCYTLIIIIYTSF